jgi:hypothetical protein
MPEHIRALLVRTGLLSAFAIGILGALVLGFIGLRAGAHGELERVLAIACLAMAAAGFVGVRADDGIAEARQPSALSVGDKLVVAVAAPLVLACLGVFVATLIPSWYLIVPFFAALWRPIFGEPARATITPEAELAPAAQPAYA